jgi:AraC family transcriptional regulator of arabinose operon
MKVVNAGYKYTHSADFVVNRPHGSGDYVLLIIKTEAFFILNGERIVAPKDSVIAYKKGTPQIYGATKNKFINDWIHFELDKNEYDELKSLGIEFDTILQTHNSSILSSLIKSVFYELYSNNLYSDDSVSLFLRLILLKLAESHVTPKPSSEGIYYDSLSKLRSDIYSFPDRDWNIESICLALNISRSHLHHLYKTTFNTTISADIMTSRIEYAKYLLFSTDIQIREISELCGYKNDVHFMRTFKAALGVTPSEYRNGQKISKDAIRKSKNNTPFSIK